jgi:hypothetical protein
LVLKKSGRPVVSDGDPLAAFFRFPAIERETSTAGQLAER